MKFEDEEENEEDPIVEVVLQAEVPVLSNKFSKTSAKDVLATPEVAPSPKAKGKAKSKNNEAKGVESVEIKGRGLAGGQSYDLYIENPAGSSIFVKVDEMELSPSGRSARYRRNTGKGGTFPFEIQELEGFSGRKFEIRDGFDAVHLEGVIP